MGELSWRSSARRPTEATTGTHPRQPGIRHIAFAVEDIDAVVAGLRSRGAELVGELEHYEDIYRLCYVSGPEGIIIELAEQIANGSRPFRLSIEPSGRRVCRRPFSAGSLSSGRTS